MLIFAQRALLPNGWATNVTIEIDHEGWIASVSRDVSKTHWHYIVGTVIPGMANLHSHAFQRIIAGTTERSSELNNDFWSWRNMMYRTALAINPDTLYQTALAVYREMLLAGYTAVAEFNYIHRDPDGVWYSDKACTSKALVQAALDAGLYICLLPALYRYGGAGEEPLESAQRRFASTAEDILEIAAAVRGSYCENGNVVVGVCAHSLRAVSVRDLRALIEASPPTAPVHLHIAEQEGEVAEIQAAYGARPVEFLLQSFALDERWTLIHATQSDPKEVAGIAETGAVVGLCPTTEANLGDGIFPFEEYLQLGGAFGIGSDSNVTISPVDELRLLEYGQRLRHRRRTIGTRSGMSCGETLYANGAAGGAHACGSRGGWLAVGMRADLVVLAAASDDAPDDSNRLDHYIFADRVPLPIHVMTSGRWRVFNGRLTT
jgi:formimidoylglutamate deiminase